MADTLGYRAVWGLLAPSRNTIVEPDMHALVPAGITIQTARIYVERSYTYDDDKGFEGLIERLHQSIPRAMEEILTCGPDRVLLGLSSESAWGGRDAAYRLQDELERMAGVPVSTPAIAIEAALHALGARRVSILSPYQAIGDAHARQFLTEAGFDVVAVKGLRLITASQIASQTEANIRSTLAELARTDCDCIVQFGTNLPVLRIADEAERWLGKPVIAANAATFWHALRQSGFRDQYLGFGPLLRSF